MVLVQRSACCRGSIETRGPAMAPVATHILHNPLADPREPTPSALDGVPEELERELRFCRSSLLHGVRNERGRGADEESFS